MSRLLVALVLAWASSSRASARGLLDDVAVAPMSPAEESPVHYVCIFYASSRHHLDIGFQAANRLHRSVSVDNAFTNQSDRRLSLGVAKVSVPNHREVAEQDGNGQENPMLDFAALQVAPSNSVGEFEKAVASPPLPQDCMSGPGTSASSGTPLLYIHGWLTPLSNALDRAAQLAVDLKRDGPVVALDWPSDKHTYSVAEAEEVIAQKQLHPVVEMIADATGRRVDVIAHSMGARLLFDGLLHWRNDGASPSDARVMLEGVVLAAPDVDRTEFTSKIAPLRSLIDGNLAVYCGVDIALSASFAKNGSRLGLCLFGTPTLANAESVAISGQVADIYRHSYFLSAPEMFVDMASVLKRDADRRDGSTRTLKLR